MKLSIASKVPRPLVTCSRRHLYHPLCCEQANYTSNIYAGRCFSGTVVGSSDRNAPPVAPLVEGTDSYLPLGLRSKGWLENLAEFEGIRSIDTFPKLLLEVKQANWQVLHEDNLLSYLALRQGRWDALLWLVESLLSKDRFEPFRLGYHQVYKHPWPNFTLDEITSGAVINSFIGRPSEASRVGPTLDEITAMYEPQQRGVSTSSLREAVGQIWQCVGNIIIEATDRDPDERKIMLSYVHQILALMHHHNAISPSIYTYKSSHRHSPISKPPVLHLMSSRIMTELSDSVWKAREKKILAEAASVGAKYVYKGHELPGAEYQPRILSLGTEVWLEFVLWNCVEGGWIAEAVEIVRNLMEKKGDQKWSAVSWDNVLGQTSQNKTDSLDSQLIRVAGASEGYSERRPIFELGSRNVSTEVIAAIIDGMTSTISCSTNDSKSSLKSVQVFVNDCRETLFARQDSSPGLTFWNAIISRLLQSRDGTSQLNVSALEDILKLWHRLLNVDTQASIAVENRSLDAEIFSNSFLACHGLLHEVFGAYTRLDDLDNALRTFNILQNWVDENRSRTFEEFWTAESKHLRQFPALEQPSVENTDTSGLYLQVPESTLAAFLNLITSTELFHLGRWLIYSEDPDGPIIRPDSLKSPSLQSALVRFAAATYDFALLGDISDELRENKETIPVELVRSLLHCQVLLGRWRPVKDLLDHLKNDRMVQLNAFDMMTIARKVLDQASMVQSDGTMRAFKEARSILELVLKPSYESRPDPSRPRTFTQARVRNQICRILASISGALKQTASSFVDDSGPASADISIPVEAFNLLLKSVVKNRGDKDGRRVYEKWCRRPEPVQVGKPVNSSGFEKIPLVKEIESSSIEQVVTPSLVTIRIVLEPTIQAIEAARNKSPKAKTNRHECLPLSNHQVSMLLWGVTKYRQLGHTDEELGLYIPMTLSRLEEERLRLISLLESGVDTSQPLWSTPVIHLKRDAQVPTLHTMGRRSRRSTTARRPASESIQSRYRPL